MQQGERYDHLREAALTLQRAMLSPPPPTPGVDIEVRHRPAGVGVEVGGDWHDVFRPADGDLAVVVGDVAGHDINAAAAMGQLRSIVRAFAVHSGPEPHDVLTHVDQVMLRIPLAAFATAVYLRVRRTANRGWTWPGRTPVTPHRSWSRPTAGLPRSTRPGIRRWAPCPVPSGGRAGSRYPPARPCCCSEREEPVLLRPATACAPARPTGRTM